MSLPQTIDANTDVSAAEVQANFDAIVTWADTLESDSGTTADDSWRTLLISGASNLPTDAVAAARFWSGMGSLVPDPLTFSSNGAGLAAIPLDDADYTLTGETPTLRVRGQVYTNATDPGTGTYTFGLHEVTAVAGITDVLTWTVNATPVTGSTAVQGDAAASTRYSVVGSAFSFPADGHYVLGVTTSATLANNAMVAVAAQLQVKVT